MQRLREGGRKGGREGGREEGRWRNQTHVRRGRQIRREERRERNKCRNGRDGKVEHADTISTLKGGRYNSTPRAFEDKKEVAASPWRHPYTNQLIGHVVFDKLQHPISIQEPA